MIMEELNWEGKIGRHRGSFIHKDELEKHSYVFQLLSGAEKFEDELSQDGDSKPNTVALVNPLYADKIEVMMQQWDQRQQQNNHIKDLTEKVAERTAGKQWVADIKPPRPFPRKSHWTDKQQRFVVDMLVRYWATGVPTNPLPSEVEDVQNLRQFIADMREEQEEYFQFAKEVNATQLSRYNFINPNLDKYIQRSMETKICRAKSTYPNNYHQLRMLPLAPPVRQPPNFFAASEPLELGEVPICVIPNLRYYTDVKRQTHFLESFFPPTDVYPKHRAEGCKPRDGSYLYKTPVSGDPNVALLSAQQEFDVVTSPSALKTLLDNSAPGWDRQWEVPVTVRLVPGTQAGSLRKVVFLDKPLPPRSMNCIERNTLAHKRTVRLLVCKRVTGPGPVDYSVWADQPDRQKTQQFKDKLAKKKKKYKHRKRQLAQELAEEQEDGEEVADVGRKKPRFDSPMEEQQEEKDGDSQPDCRPDTAVSAAAPSSATAPPDTEGSDSDDDMGLQIDCSDEEEPKTTEREPAKEPAEEGEPTVNEGEEQEESEGGGYMEGDMGMSAMTCGEFPSVVNKELTSGDGPVSDPPVKRSDAARCPAADSAASSDAGGAPGALVCPEAGEPTAEASGPPPAPLEPTEPGEGTLPKDADKYLRPPPGLNVHYRVWQLGGLRLLIRAATHAMRETANVGLVRYTVHAKPAYQPGLGIEVMTRSELITQWLDCLLRPNSRVVRVHLDPISQLVITPEERTLAQLTEEFVKYDTGFRPPYGLQVVESLLRDLISLTPGQYLLSHDTRTGAFVRLARADNSSCGAGRCLNLPSQPLKVALESPRCLSIDPSILTPFNTRYGRVPATFSYARTLECGEEGWKVYWSKRKKEGFTRKKKKKNKAHQQKQIPSKG